ncbi:MAG: fused MFS/spermidine synthase [Candidatus Gracilibacteria bacterium]|nr:fused MFS/spermidine synthase [Candidatus Gracilibacteria bacterium]
MNLVYFLVVFLEGFTTLSVEIIAIRKCMSIIGSNSVITSIILGVILIALSYGYYMGGKIASNSSREFIVKRLFINLFLASIIYTLFSFPFENVILSYFLSTGLGYAFSILVSIFILFFIPVFLASQTIPLLNELIENEKKSELVGKLLFYSTIGSFIGSMSSSIVFFPLIGVTKTIVLNGLILSSLSLVIILTNKKYFKDIIMYVNVFFAGLFLYLLFIDLGSGNTVYSYSTAHNDINIIDYDLDKRVMLLNGGYSSGINRFTKESYFTYINETEKLIKEYKPKNILVIGGAGFSLPYNVAKYDFVENIDVCDIDEKLYEVSQKYFLEDKLDEKIQFYPIPARYLLNIKSKEGVKYDFIFVDAYAGQSVPSQLLTKEFYDGLKKISEGIISFNYIFDQEKKSDFYKKTVNTLYESLGNVYIKNVSGYIADFGNYIVIDKENELYNKLQKNADVGIYTDDKGTQEIDKYNLYKDKKR